MMDREDGWVNYQIWKWWNLNCDEDEKEKKKKFPERKNGDKYKDGLK